MPARTYELITELESGGVPTLAPFDVGTPTTTSHALNEASMTASGYNPKSFLTPVADLIALGAITPANRVDGSFCFVLSNLTMYRCDNSGSETADGYKIINANTSGRWKKVEPRIYRRLENSSYVVTNLDEMILGNPSVANITYTLPAPSSDLTGKVYQLGNRSSTYDIVVAGNGANIEGNATYTLKKNSDFISIMYDGSEWFIVSQAWAGKIPIESIGDLGDENTDGSWRFVKSGNDLAFQRRESSTWVTKFLMEA